MADYAIFGDGSETRCIWCFESVNSHDETKIVHKSTCRLYEVQPLKIGDKIHVGASHAMGQDTTWFCRPGIVTEVWDLETGCINATVFTIPDVDGSEGGSIFVTSILPGFGPMEWHRGGENVDLEGRVCGV